MSTENQDDLDLLLSLQDRVIETPPSSPSSSHPRSLGYQSDDEVRRPSGNVDLSAFKTAVEDCMDYDVETATKAFKSNQSKKPTDLDVEKFSGLRIRNQVISSAELSNQFSDIRFVRLSTIKNVIKGDTLSGSWATVGVLTEKGSPKTSSTGKSYSIWKIGCLDGQLVTVFLFGDAYKQHSKETASTVFAFFNAGVRKDSSGPGFQLSVFNTNQILKIGTSIDYGVCKGRRKDGVRCSIVVNKRLGIYCSFHRVKTSEKYTVQRGELKGGNLRTAFRNPRQPEGVYMFDPMADKANRKKSKSSKVLSVDGLKKALSNAGHVTTNSHSQGIRFLNEITVSMSAKTAKSENAQKNQVKVGSMKRSLPTSISGSSVAQKNSLPDSKRVRPEPRKISSQKLKETTNKMIELEYVSSEDDCFV
uniref:Zinc finger Mcm10/DnaG-type domain-containing protein n=2 Tax=Chenopodium quinoa TaxID=63459 RepID=A0A803LGE1_CHEQI